MHNLQQDTSLTVRSVHPEKTHSVYNQKMYIAHNQKKHCVYNQRAHTAYSKKGTARSRRLLWQTDDTGIHLTTKRNTRFNQKTQTALSQNMHLLQPENIHLTTRRHTSPGRRHKVGILHKAQIAYNQKTHTTFIPNMISSLLFLGLPKRFGLYRCLKCYTFQILFVDFQTLLWK